MNTKPLDHAIGATAVADMLLAGWRAVERLLLALRNRREIESLIAADERMLRDIGITRQDLDMALSRPLSDDPSAELSDMRARARRGDGLLHCSTTLSDSRQRMSGSR